MPGASQISKEIFLLIVESGNEFDPRRFHMTARRAVDRMRRMAAVDLSGINVFSERQLVHEVGYFLNRSFGWVGFEQDYPSTKKLGDRRAVADIRAFYPNDDFDSRANLWIEVKSTGFTQRHSRENQFGLLRWQKDFENLNSLDNRIENSTHHCHWVWLYLFQTYRPEVEYHFGRSQRWSSTRTAEEAVEIFQIRQSSAVTLSSLLTKIHEECPETMVSCLPGLVDGDAEFSALLVTSKIR